MGVRERASGYPILGDLTAPRVTEAEYAPSKGSEADALLRLKRAARLDRARVTVVLAMGEYQILQIEPPQVPEADTSTSSITVSSRSSVKTFT